MADTVWSSQQIAIFDWFANPVAREAQGYNLVVRARAGTGKSTTIRAGIGRAPEGSRLVAAFNTKIKEEAAKKFAEAGDFTTEVKTLHGVGFACVRLYRDRIRVEERKGTRQDMLAERVCGAQAPDAIKRLVGKLLTKGREMAPLAQTPGDLLDIALEFECVPDETWAQAGFDLGYVEARALEAMAAAALVKSGEEIDYADMLFLPVRNNWLQATYDLVVVDEAQDMNMTQLIIARGVCRGRFAIVGDDRQALYAFRGADSGSLDRLKTELDAQELGLTVTYRCAKAIVAEAAALVPDIQAAADAPDGEITALPSFEALVAASAPHDFILSRTNAPLAKVAMAHIRAGKAVKIQGKDIGAGLKAVIRKLATGPAANSIPALLQRLAKWEEREVDRVRKADRPEREEGIRDKAETLRVVCDGVSGVRELEARLDSLFSDNLNGGAVICSSVHKAKGLEAERVFVLRPTLYPKMPPGVKVSAARAREEQNIHYVAVTRAMRRLVWVEAK